MPGQSKLIAIMAFRLITKPRPMSLASFETTTARSWPSKKRQKCAPRDRLQRLPVATAPFAPAKPLNRHFLVFRINTVLAGRLRGCPDRSLMPEEKKPDSTESNEPVGRRELWEKRLDESDKAFNAFVLYRDAEKRSFKIIAEQLNCSPKTSFSGRRATTGAGASARMTWSRSASRERNWPARPRRDAEETLENGARVEKCRCARAA